MSSCYRQASPSLHTAVGSAGGTWQLKNPPPSKVQKPWHVLQSGRQQGREKQIHQRSKVRPWSQQISFCPHGISTPRPPPPPLPKLSYITLVPRWLVVTINPNRGIPMRNTVGRTVPISGQMPVIPALPSRIFRVPLHYIL